MKIPSKTKFFPLLAVAFAPALWSTPGALAAPMAIQNAKIKTVGQDDEENIARLAQDDERLAKLESLMFDLVNAERKKAGLKLLVLDSVLSDISRAHSAEMRDKKYFAHESPTEELHEPLDRYQIGTGSSPRLIAENIFRSWGSRREVKEAQAREAHDSLMKSPGHKANILRDGPTRIGIGFQVNSNGDLWVTQMFSIP